VNSDDHILLQVGEVRGGEKAFGEVEVCQQHQVKTAAQGLSQSYPVLDDLLLLPSFN
jgi:hypothetical protein